MFRDFSDPDYACSVRVWSTGAVTVFRNPDKPKHPDSDRIEREAQEWAAAQRAASES